MHRPLSPQMPTRDGDIVISHPEQSTPNYVLWVVLEDGQEEAPPDAFTYTALGRTAALHLAAGMARENRGAVFLREVETSAWTRVS
jgi:hypothetical protein